MVTAGLSPSHKEAHRATLLGGRQKPGPSRVTGNAEVSDPQTTVDIKAIS